MMKKEGDPKEELNTWSQCGHIDVSNSINTELKLHIKKGAIRRWGSLD